MHPRRYGARRRQRTPLWVWLLAITTCLAGFLLGLLLSPGPLGRFPIVAPSPSPSPTQTPEPTAEPITLLQPGDYYSTTALLPVYSQAQSSSKIVDTLLPGCLLKLKIDLGDMACVVTEQDDVGFVDSSALVSYNSADPDFWFVVPESVDKNGKKNTLVDIRSVDPTIQTDIIFATERNFTGEVLYGRPVCLLQRETAQRLAKAQAIFQKDGYCIKVYDAYRPHSVQYKLYERIGNSRYIADPDKASAHNSGCAVDITLVDSAGRELEMPSAMHVFNSTAHRDSKEMSAEARKNMNYMADVMQSVGFEVYNYEWWHFYEPNRADYAVSDINLAALEIVLAE